jgi:hypothetical protein
MQLEIRGNNARLSSVIEQGGGHARDTSEAGRIETEPVRLEAASAGPVCEGSARASTALRVQRGEKRLAWWRQD